MDEHWPVADEAALAADAVEIVVQVNGKVRGRISVPAGAGEDAVKAAALAEENVGQASSPASRCAASIVVPGKLVNVVV